MQRSLFLIISLLIYTSGLLTMEPTPKEAYLMRLNELEQELTTIHRELDALGAQCAEINRAATILVSLKKSEALPALPLKKRKRTAFTRPRNVFACPLGCEKDFSAEKVIDITRNTLYHIYTVHKETSAIDKEIKNHCKTHQNKKSIPCLYYPLCKTTCNSAKNLFLHLFCTKKHNQIEFETIYKNIKNTTSSVKKQKIDV